MTLLKQVSDRLFFREQFLLGRRHHLAGKVADFKILGHAFGLRDRGRATGADLRIDVDLRSTGQFSLAR